MNKYFYFKIYCIRSQWQVELPKKYLLYLIMNLYFMSIFCVDKVFRYLSCLLNFVTVGSGLIFYLQNTMHYENMTSGIYEKKFHNQF